MKTRLVYSTLYVLLVCLMPQDIHPCTIFCLDKSDQLVLGKNTDWTSNDGLVIVNKRNVSKTSMLIKTEDGQPASWTSKYGSVTFNIAREMPSGGMNEAGLVVENAGLEETEYPPSDSRHCINPIQWIQYQLDNYNSVEEVIASDSKLRIKTGRIPLHYLVCDKMGNCAVIEILDGEMVYYTKETLPVEVISNFNYEFSLMFLYEHEGWGGDLPIPEGEGPLKRFVRAADMIKKYESVDGESAVDYAFDILANVAQTGVYQGISTQCSIVYDIQNLRVCFHTIENEQTMYFDLSSFDFSCKTPVKVLDVTADLSGDVSNAFIDYTYEINRSLIEKTFPDLPDEEKDIIANYPETTVCTEIDCFITTAVYGSPMEPQVNLLREFRDRFLLDNKAGKSFVHLYNTYSSPLADFISSHDNLRAMVCLSLLPMVGLSWGALKLGPILTMLIILLFLAMISTTTIVILRKK